MSILDRSESRQGQKVRLLVVHSTEGNGTAQALRDATWWTGSSHAINDESGTLLTPAQGCVPYDRAAWTTRKANLFSESIEQVGWAKWTRKEWLARPLLLEGTARWLADRSKARNIPLVRLSVADIKAGKAGVIGHADWSGTGDGTHSDPGPNYPWDVVLARATELRFGGTTVSLTQPEINAISDAVANRGLGPFGAAWQTWNAAAQKADEAVKAIAALDAKVSQLIAKG